ncbi:hypothetical protein QSU96_19000 [Vibrio furnissii]|uniref:hypothetical protein n=1 Tax=Vibrio furnissii TaxID=29494 RepID=UPI002572611F|nr:hypothetical protein [Vibrio furnissii]WJG29044.1 hypothetical protein QSU96_19000 [Vibrio furnissii]
MIQKIRSWLLNPFVNISLAVLIGFVFYRLSIQNIELSYSVSKAEELFSHEFSGEQIQLVDEKGEVVIDTVYLKRVVLWNSGDKYIEKTDFFKTNPLIVSISDEAKLISSKIIRSSRESLDVSVEKVQAGSVEVKLGDDALESGDGVVVSLLYTGVEEPEVTLTGRIRGISNDFNNVNWVYLNSANVFTKSSALLFIASILIGGAVLILNGFCLLENSPKLKFVTNSVIGLSCGILLFSAFSGVSYTVLVGSFYSIGWL